MTKSAFLLGNILFSLTACHTDPTITFHYQYDASKEVLDTTSTVNNAWYVPIEKKYVNFYNSQGLAKCLIDPATLRGIFWKPNHVRIRSLHDWDLPDVTKYYVAVSAEGIGFDGYSIASFLRVRDGGINVDGAYGTFSDNDQRNYSCSFYNEEMNQSSFNDSITKADRFPIGTTTLREKRSYAFQWFGADSLASRRKYNTLFFGLVPPLVVEHALSKSADNLLIELTAEDYEFRLLNCKTKFGSDVRAVDQTYLKGAFQSDWRYLITRATFDETVIDEVNISDSWLDLRAYPSGSGPDAEEQNLFPNLNIQDQIFKVDSSNTAGDPNESTADVLEDIYEKAPRQKKLFQIAKSNCLQRELIGTVGSDSVKLTFDTSVVNRNGKTKNKTILGNGLIALCYIGEEGPHGEASGGGTLYLAPQNLDTARSGYATVSGSFKNGYLDGPFKYYWHDPTFMYTPNLLADGEYDKGRLSGKLERFSSDVVLPHPISVCFYADGVFRKDTMTLFHNYDALRFFGQHPKLSDAYMGYIGDELAGFEIPNDTTFQGGNVSTFIRDDAIYFKFSDNFMVVPFYRDYIQEKITPINPVTTYFDNGTILVSNWDSKYWVGGPAEYYVPGVGWQPTTVTNGGWHYFVQHQDQSSGLGKLVNDVGNFITNTFTSPLSIPSRGLDLIKGKENAAQAFAGIKSDLLSTVGANLTFNGDIVHLTGLAGQKLIDLTAPAFKTMQDCNNALFPLAFKISLQRPSGGNNLDFLGNEAVDLMRVASWAPEFGARISNSAAELAAKSAVLTGIASEKLGEYMELAAGGFPKPIVNPFEHGTVSQATATVSVSAKVLQRILDKTFAKPINENDPILKQISITGPSSITFSTNQQAIDLSISGGNISGTDIVSGTVTIDHASMEFLPALTRQNGHFFLELHAILTNLDLKNCLQEVDKMVAWALQTELFDRRPIASVDVTSLLTQDLKMALKGQKELSTNTFRDQHFSSSINLDNLAWSISGGVLTLSTALSIHNQTAGTPYSDVSPGKKSEVVTALGKLFGLECNGFPEIKTPPLPTPIGDTDLMVSLDERFMENLVGNMFSRPIEVPLSQDTAQEMSNNYIVINKMTKFNMNYNNRIEVGVSADFWYRTLHPFVLKTRLRIPEFNLVLTPQIIRKNDTTWLVFPAQIETMRIEGLKLPLDQCIANYVTKKHYLDQHDSLDLSPALAIHIKSPLDSTIDIAPKITQTSVVTDRNQCRIYIKVE